MCVLQTAENGEAQKRVGLQVAGSDCLRSWGRLLLLAWVKLAPVLSSAFFGVMSGVYFLAEPRCSHKYEPQNQRPGPWKLLLWHLWDAKYMNRRKSVLKLLGDAGIQLLVRSVTSLGPFPSQRYANTIIQNDTLRARSQ